MIRIQTEPFDVGREISTLTNGRTDVGAVVTFTGLVREMTPEGAISSMTLEHYPGMTEGELERIEAEARGRWPLQDILVVHRVGPLHPGEVIVLVITLSAHREAAFEAAQFVMDYLKTSAPFWKKETRRSGEATWVTSRDSDDRARERWRAS